MTAGRPAITFEALSRAAVDDLAVTLLGAKDTRPELLEQARAHLAKPSIEVIARALPTAYDVQQLRVLRAYLRREPIPCSCATTPGTDEDSNDE